MTTAIIDTNILVSALMKPAGSEAGVVKAIQSGRVVPAYSGGMFTEYRTVLFRPRFGFYLPDVETLLQLLKLRGMCVASEAAVIPEAFVSPDADDNKFIAAAIGSGATFLVTGNRRHFPGPAYGSALVVNAPELLRLLPAPP